MTEKKSTAKQAANKKLLAQAEALLAKKKANLAAIEKQQSDIKALAAAAAQDAKQARADSVLLQLANKKAAEEQAAYKAEENNKSGSGSSFTTSTYTPAATPPTPPPIAEAIVVAPAVKTAPIDTVLFNDEDVIPELMEKLYFENIGGHELINIARNDVINGQDISYQPIKNLSSLQQQYNPNNILSLQSTSDKYFSNFAIKLENKIPNVGNGPFGSNVYLDVLNGSLVVDLINMESDEQVEIEITLSGTIYEADLTGSES